MASISYLINMHAGLFFFATGGILAAVLIGALFLCHWFSKKVSIPSGISTTLFVVFVLGCMAAVFFGISMFSSINDMGGVRNIFVVQTEGRPKLAVWCTRIYGKKTGAEYEQYIRTFDLTTAELQGAVKLDDKYFSDDYRLYWWGGRDAWGYRKDSGVKLIDLATPAVLADNTLLIKRHPFLENGFLFESFKDLADPDNSGLYVKSANGNIYRLKEDLSAARTDHVPQDENVDRSWSSPENWYFYPLKNSKGKHAHTRGASCALDESATLLTPEFIPEMNRPFSNAEPRKRVWVTHRSALLGDYDRLLSYVGENGGGP